MQQSSCKRAGAQVFGLKQGHEFLSAIPVGCSVSESAGGGGMTMGRNKKVIYILDSTVLKLLGEGKWLSSQALTGEKE